MTDSVRDSYDARAKEYAELFLDDLDRAPLDRKWLGAFAQLAHRGPGFVADLGCGPGHIVHHLAQLNVTAVGYDISPAMIDEARRAFPALEFQVGDLMSLDVADSSLAGIVARYSIIHLPPAELKGVFGEWFRALKPEAPMLVSFFASRSPLHHGRPFDHAVATAYELCLETLVSEMQSGGFDRFEIATQKPPDGGRPLDHGTILARRSNKKSSG